MFRWAMWICIISRFRRPIRVTMPPPRCFAPRRYAGISMAEISASATRFPSTSAKPFMRQ